MVQAVIDRIGSAFASVAASGTEATFWLPKGASTVARDVDWNWNFVYWISMVFFIGITVAMIWLIWAYRSRPGHSAQPSPSHNTPLEIVWSVIPTGIVVAMFWFGYTTYLDMATPPRDAYEIQVTGQKWNWMFQYPNGYIDGNLHVPVDTPVRLVMSSIDVMHAFYVPEFRIKRDVVPGRYTKLWFNANQTGEFDILCAEYCGTDHSTMLAKVYVHELGEFDAWLEEASDFLSKMPPAEAGEMLYNMRGCKQCHSLDGVAGTGPTFLGLYGNEDVLTTGERVLVDENYVRESILMPQVKVVAGYEPVMPTYQGRLKDEEIGAIIEFLKSIGKDGGQE